jgi:hypothetical protein
VLQQVYQRDGGRQKKKKRPPHGMAAALQLMVKGVDQDPPTPFRHHQKR